MKSILFLVVGVFLGVAAVFVIDPASLRRSGQEAPARVATLDAVLLKLSPEKSLRPDADDGENREEALREAEMELQLLTENMLSARKAIDEAVVMVREQKENFDFARDRYEKLMPLVETGALEPLAASQIQSAYISAGASLSKAKYLLSQASRDYQSENARRWKLAAARKRVESLRETSTAATGGKESATEAKPDLAQSTDNAAPIMNEPTADPPKNAVARVTAYFSLPPGSATSDALLGKVAQVSLPALPGRVFEATIFAIRVLSEPGEVPVRIEAVMYMESLPADFTRDAAACEVTLPEF